MKNSNTTSHPSCGRGRGRFLLSIASFVAAIVLALVGMWMPPQGEISGSVLILVAQLLVLCATLLGVKDLKIMRNS